MVGGVISVRLTLNVQLLLMPAASVAVIVMVVVPAPFTMVPGAGDWVNTMAFEALQLSEALACMR
jgi:cell division protein FtsW (lipid II flippase)